MNLNPFVFKYKVYPESKRATNISHMSSAGERIGFLFGGGILIMCLISPPNNVGEALFAAIAFLGGGWYIHKNKEEWCNNALLKDGVSIKQNELDEGEIIHSSVIQKNDAEKKSQNLITETENSEVKAFCSQCGYKVEPSARFCPRCGHEL